ncbi:hypothetical protein A4D02_09810 [Niastella koreensis]|uniref:Outer membrane protein beta-barrel domain-containing protein n=2 Tax=Niastella koreensis TaxID=354356 RepID=G8TND2_NIAKG|nr:porin family protein [Niastella koreensis]AEV98834.1 hypothetical protein Niako_2494 [Niastella koreensis GR20-10]OQP43769.1 hypothetical protein A4D02_09810 [Niastella koreensis]
MKRYICILVASTFLVSTVKAQISYGVKAGGNITAMLGTYTYTSDKVGFNAGVFGALPLNKSFSLQAELYYSAQGEKQWYYTSNSWDPVSGSFTDGHYIKIPNRMSYLNLPVLVKFKTTCGCFIEAGLQAGWLISAHSKTPDGKVDEKDLYRSFDFSGTAGLGYQFPFGLGVDLRYNRSLMSVLKSNAYSTYNSVAQLGLFYVLSKH